MESESVNVERFTFCADPLNVFDVFSNAKSEEHMLRHER